MSISRRDFVRAAAGVAAAGVGGGAAGMAQAQAVQAGGEKGPGGPVFVSSPNGKPSCEKAVELLKGGMALLEAIVKGINLVEENAEDHSVGLGGLPNEDGVVELDACVMDGATHKAGAVAALRNIKNPSSVALLVMRRTDHVLLVGEGALRFAKAHGFPEEELLTREAREIWLKWKETHSDNDDWLPSEDENQTGTEKKPAQRWPADGPEFTWGTVTCLGLTAEGNLAGCTSTSGLSYKIPGRVGDSPIIGAGLYVDNDAGACGSTGRGEANLQNCSSFMIVELMRQGRTPNEAALEVLRRIASKTEKRLRNEKGEPNFGLCFYALRKDGLAGGGSMHPGGKIAHHDGKECKIIEVPSLLM